MMRNWLVVFACLQTTLSLNILLTSTDSWVSNNVRQLYHQLSKNHTVILTGSLYNHQLQYIDDISNGGDFNHLLPINQIYYRNVDLVNQRSKMAFGGYGAKGPTVGAKGVIFGLNTEQPVPQQQPELIKNQFFGQDPQDPNVWFVNDHSLNGLIKTFDIILPTYYPNFTPDLLVVASSELIEGEVPDYHNKMLDYGLHKMVTTMVISSKSLNHVYYKDEIASLENQDKVHYVHWKLKFLNYKIQQIIDLLETTAKLKIYGIRLNLPNTDYSHKCHRTKPKFLQIESTLKFDEWEFPQFTHNNDQLRTGATTKLDRQNMVVQYENSLSLSDVLDMCNVSMEIVDHHGNNVAKDQFDLQYNLSLQPDPRFRKRTWRRFFKLRFYQRKLRYFLYRLMIWD